MADGDAGYITTTTAGVFIPEVWEKEIIQALYGDLIADRVGWVKDAPKGTDTVHVPKLKALTAEQVVEGTALTGKQNTEIEVTIPLDQHWAVPLTISKRTVIQSMKDISVLDVYSRAAGKALAAHLDTKYFALYSGLSQTVDCLVEAAADDITDAYFREAIQVLDDAKVPMDDRHLVISPAQRKVMLGIDKFVDASKLGDNQAIRKGLLGELYGVKIWMSPYLTKATTRKNLLFHRDWACLAIQQAVEYEMQYMVMKKAYDLAPDILYGLAEMQDEMAVVITTQD